MFKWSENYIKNFLPSIIPFSFPSIEKHSETWFITRKIPNNIVFTALIARRKSGHIAQSFSSEKIELGYEKKCPFNARVSNIFNQIEIELNDRGFALASEWRRRTKNWKLQRRIDCQHVLMTWKGWYCSGRCVWQIKMMKRFHYVGMSPLSDKYNRRFMH